MKFWKDRSKESPTKVGEYLVIQDAPFGKEGRTKWVRFWDGSEFYDCKTHRYGPVTKWAEIPNEKE